MKSGNFDKYDQLKLQEAKRYITEVYEYNYGVPHMNRKIKKLETIIKKINELMEEDYAKKKE